MRSSETKVPRDREGSFEPASITKRHNIIDIITSFYSKGKSVSDIEQQIHEVYDFEVSTSTISRITNAVINEVANWQNRTLEDLYLIVWIDGIVFKIINKTIYLAV